MLIQASTDVGNMIRRRPRVVVRPQCAEDVARVVRYAYERDLSLTARAGANSFGGQALSDGGLALDLRGMKAIGPIHLVEGWFDAAAGALWTDVAEATLPYGVLPPVFSSYLRTSVGGTHSAAGLGTSSFAWGTQVDSCMELDVVIHTGDIVRCSIDENRDLFEHVLGGYGQFGVITRVRHRLRPFKPHTRSFFLYYDELEALLTDQRLLLEDGRFGWIDGLITPCYHGQRMVKGRPDRFHTFSYTMKVTVEAEDTGTIDDERLLEGLQFRRWLHAEDLAARDFTLIGRGEDMDMSPRIVRVFVDVILPWSSVERMIEILERHIYPNIVYVNHMLLSPMTRRHLTRPMLRVPEEPMMMGLGVYTRVPQANGPATLTAAQSIVDLAMSMGGTYYLSGSIRLDAPRLARQFGDIWPGVQSAKHRFDPKGLFNPGFFSWDDN